METTVVRFEAKGRCDHSGKDGVEVAVVRMGNCEKRVAVKSLLDVLRWNAALPAADGESPRVIGVNDSRSAGESASQGRSERRPAPREQGTATPQQQA